MILQPPAKVATDDITPKELVFVLDTSGSMMGFPIEKAKESMKAALAGLNPRDTFNLITFSGDTYVLFPKPPSLRRAGIAASGARAAATNPISIISPRLPICCPRQARARMPSSSRPAGCMTRSRILKPRMTSSRNGSVCASPVSWKSAPTT